MPRVAVPPSAAVGSPPMPSAIDRRGSHDPGSILTIGDSSSSPVPPYVVGLKNTFVHAEVKNPIISIPLQMSRSAPVDETMLSLPPGLDDAPVRDFFFFVFCVFRDFVCLLHVPLANRRSFFVSTFAIHLPRATTVKLYAILRVWPLFPTPAHAHDD